jgi:hypothetical protein
MKVNCNQAESPKTLHCNVKCIYFNILKCTFASAAAKYSYSS